MSTNVYITLSEEDRVSVYNMDSTGQLEKTQDINVNGRPAPLAMDPAARFVYVGSRNSCEVSSFEVIRNRGGALQFINKVPLESDPCYLSTDRSGKFLLSAYYAAGKVDVHKIDDTGSILEQHVCRVITCTGAHCIQTDPSNRFAFVPHVAAPYYANTIFQLRFDENTGCLTGNTPDKISLDDPLGPRHFCFHPTLDIVYTSNEQDCSVSAYKFNPTEGNLSLFQTISTMPEPIYKGSTCSQIQISSSGRFLYAPIRGHNTIACFTVALNSGKLTRIGLVPAEPVPRAFSLDPAGRYLLSAGLYSGKLGVYSISGDNGELHLLKTYDVGQGPMWVLVANV